MPVSEAQRTYRFGEPCPVCGSQVSPVRNKKTPKSPDYRCSNRECNDGSGYGFSAWAPDGAKPAQVPARAPIAAPPSRSSLGVSLDAWDTLEKAYERAVDIAVGVATRQTLLDSATPEVIAAMAATVLISAQKMGLLEGGR